MAPEMSRKMPTTYFCSDNVTVVWAERAASRVDLPTQLKALAGRGAPDVNVRGSDIPISSLPHCQKPKCGGLLRPHIVWFGENLDIAVLDKAKTAMSTCDVCLVVGTSSVVYPAAMFAPEAAARGAIVAEFNLAPTPATSEFHFYFQGPCGTTLPEALSE